MSARLPCPYPVAETMEERILHSADLAPLLIADAAGGMALQQALQQPASTAAATPVREIVFVDTSLPDAQGLLDDLRAQRLAGRRIDLVTIAADQDGLAVIGATLATRHDIGAVHVLAHGSDGALQLGATRLDAQTLLARAAEVAGWSGALTGDADVLLYGCDLAQTVVGQQLVQDLAALTGADVAASTDLTGAAAAGGNWRLEYQSGKIEAGSALSFAEQWQWQGVMATYTVTTTNDMFLGIIPIPGSLRWAIGQANANAGTDTIIFALNGTFGMNPVFSGGNDNSSGDFDVTQSVNIVGNGTANTVIAGYAGDRVFDLRGGTINISGLTVQGGTSAEGAGFAVRPLGSRLRPSRSPISTPLVNSTR